MSYDAFISYAHEDKEEADAICAELESAHVRCWIAPRDIVPGSEWGKSIVEGIKSCRIMILVFTGRANASPQVLREVERAANNRITILTVRCEDVTPSGSMEYFLGPSQWFDAVTPPLQDHLPRLADAVHLALGLPRAEPNPGAAKPRTSRGLRATAATAVATLVLIGTGLVVRQYWGGSGSPETDTNVGTATAPSQIPVDTQTTNPPPASSEVSRINLKPLSLNLTIGQQQRLSATGFDGDGNRASDIRIVWHSSDALVATVDSLTGVVTGVGRGFANITASAGAVRNSARAKVDSVPGASGTVVPDVAGTRRDSITSSSSSKDSVGKMPLPSEARATESHVRAAVDNCERALRTADTERLRALFVQSSDSEKALLKLMSDRSAKLHLDTVVHGSASLEDATPHGKFDTFWSWRSEFGSGRKSKVAFQVDLRATGGQWVIGSCRIVGTPRLN